MKNQKEKFRKQSYSPISTKRVKYFRINLPKEIKELCAENYKTMMKEIKDNTHRWRDIPCSWIRRLNIIKRVILPNLIYRFNIIPRKIQARNSADTDKVILRDI